MSSDDLGIDLNGDIGAQLDDAEYLNAMDDLDKEPSIQSEEVVSNHEWDAPEKIIKTDEEEMNEEEKNDGPPMDGVYGFKLPKDEVWYRQLLLEWIECDNHIEYKGKRKISTGISKPLPHHKPHHPIVNSKLLPRVFLDVSRGNKLLGRMIFILFPSVAPHACENFRSLCTGEKGLGKSGNPLHLKDTHFFKNIAHYYIQGGDTTNGDGSGGESIWGQAFNDEISHGKIKLNRGYLITANSGPQTNRSQFCILYDEAEWLENTATVFGVLDEGHDVLQLMEEAGLESDHIDPVTHTPTRNAAKSPYRLGGESHPLIITNCGQLVLKVNKTKLNKKPHYNCEWVEN
jgi:peptidylprolyl isomerase